MYTIVETAKANKVNVYRYTRYLLEKVPGHLEDKNLNFLEDMLPWSEMYLSYEKTQTMSIPNLVLKENENDTRWRFHISGILLVLFLITLPI